MFEPVVARCSRRRAARPGYVSMCFGDPWEGDVPVEEVVSASRRLLDLGCHELSLGDTIGVGTPGHVEALLGGLAEAGRRSTRSPCTSTTPTARRCPTR